MRRILDAAEISSMTFDTPTWPQLRPEQTQINERFRELPRPFHLSCICQTTG
jgi:hypothetical protein